MSIVLYDSYETVTMWPLKPFEFSLKKALKEKLKLTGSHKITNQVAIITLAEIKKESKIKESFYNPRVGSYVYLVIQGISTELFCAAATKDNYRSSLATLSILLGSTLIFCRKKLKNKDLTQESVLAIHSFSIGLLIGFSLQLQNWQLQLGPILFSIILQSYLVCNVEQLSEISMGYSKLAEKVEKLIKELGNKNLEINA